LHTVIIRTTTIALSIYFYRSYISISAIVGTVFAIYFVFYCIPCVFLLNTKPFTRRNLWIIWSNYNSNLLIKPFWLMLLCRGALILIRIVFRSSWGKFLYLSWVSIGIVALEQRALERIRTHRTNQSMLIIITILRGISLKEITCCCCA